MATCGGDTLLVCVVLLALAVHLAAADEGPENGVNCDVSTGECAEERPTNKPNLPALIIGCSMLCLNFFTCVGGSMLMRLRHRRQAERDAKAESAPAAISALPSFAVALPTGELALAEKPDSQGPADGAIKQMEAASGDMHIEYVSGIQVVVLEAPEGGEETHHSGIDRVTESAAHLTPAPEAADESEATSAPAPEPPGSAPDNAI